jgi:Zn-dependent metalloprotease
MSHPRLLSSFFLVTGLVALLLACPGGSLAAAPGAAPGPRAHVDLPAAPQPPPQPPPCGGVYTVAADATVKRGDPNTNFGADAVLQVAKGSKGSLPEDRTLLDFQLPKEFPSGQAIESAWLELALYDASLTTSYAMQAAGLSAGWDESQVTWNSQPSSGPSFPAVTYAQPYVSPDVSILRVDVTALVNLWSTGALAQTGLALWPAGDAQSQARFHSRESSKGAYAPRLVVNCAPPLQAPPPDGAALDALQLAGLQEIRDDSLTPPVLLVEYGALRWAEFTIPVPAGVAQDPTGRALWFLQNYGAGLRLSDPLAQLQLERRSDDQTSIVFRQRHQGVPVYPGKVAVRLEGDNITGVSGNYLPDLNVDPTPTIPTEQAEAIALAMAGAGAQVHGETRLRYVNHGLTGGPDKNTYLVWQVNVVGDPRLIFVDAHTGQARGAVSSAQVDYDLDIENVNGEDESTWCLRWNFTTADDHECDENGCISGANAESTRAWWSMRAVDYFYRHYLGRDSYDNDGAEIQMYVNLNWDNAHHMSFCHWLEFGVGYTVQDVVGHEFTHAVQVHTSDLDYENESGALNESFADLLAELSETSPDWLHGEGLPHGASRSFSNPHAGRWAQPDTYLGTDWYPLSDNPDPDKNDNGGVHYNSGVPNKAAWLIIHGGSFAGHNFTQPLGIEKGAHLFYDTLRMLADNATMMDARRMAVRVAEISVGRWGITWQDVCTVRNAYHAVGLGSADTDCDRIEDDVDPDLDGDAVPNSVDNCPSIANGGQQNADGDSQGDACDDDDDNDGWKDHADHCPLVYDPEQKDWDGDGRGDVCDDSDDDGRMDDRDNCVSDGNRDQRDTDRDGWGDVCDPDDDGDVVADGVDNCSLVPNLGQANKDGDPFGDACDWCRTTYSTTNFDIDRDGIGDVCDPDNDNDGIPDDGDSSSAAGDTPCTGGNTVNCDDNCRKVANRDQLDLDGDGIGGACEREDGLVFGNEVNAQALLSQAYPLRIPMPDACLECAAGYLAPGYRDLVTLELPVPFYAQVVDTDGGIVGFTAPHPHGLRQTVSFAPAPYAFNSLRSLTAGAAGGALPGAPDPSLPPTPPDGVRYYVEIYPTGAYDPGVPYSVSASFAEAAPKHGIYLPLALRPSK